MDIDTILALTLTAIAAVYLARRAHRYLTAEGCGSCGAKKGCPAVELPEHDRT